MEAPSLSELERIVLSLSDQIKNLQLRPSDTSKEPPGGVLFPAGSFITCRPSKFKAIVDRLGSENIEIVDTEETRGFVVTSLDGIDPWDRTVYPRDIGPSCRGITSKQGRIEVSYVGDAVTPEYWNPQVPLGGLGGGGGTIINGGVWVADWTAFTRTLWITNARGSDLALKNPGASFTRLYTPKHPKAGQKPSQGIFKTLTGGERWSNLPYPSGAISKYMDLNENSWSDMSVVNKNPSYFDNVLARWIYYFDPAELYLIFDDTQGAQEEFCYYPNMYRTDLLYSNQLSQVTIRAEKLLSANPTPKLVYGSYDGDNEPEKRTLVFPHWGRTNLIQIKIINDVRIASRAI